MALLEMFILRSEASLKYYSFPQVNADDTLYKKG